MPRPWGSSSKVPVASWPAHAPPRSRRPSQRPRRRRLRGRGPPDDRRAPDRVGGQGRAAAEGADLLYTDVWGSMGMEEEAAQRERDFAGYQINEALVALANEDALVMHCLPAYRGKEIDAPPLEAHADTIFPQAENRLHAQKAILNLLVS